MGVFLIKLSSGCWHSESLSPLFSVPPVSFRPSLVFSLPQSLTHLSLSLSLSFYLFLVLYGLFSHFSPLSNHFSFSYFFSTPSYLCPFLSYFYLLYYLSHSLLSLFLHLQSLSLGFLYLPLSLSLSCFFIYNLSPISISTPLSPIYLSAPLIPHSLCAPFSLLILSLPLLSLISFHRPLLPLFFSPFCICFYYFPFSLT